MVARRRSMRLCWSQVNLNLKSTLFLTVWPVVMAAQLPPGSPMPGPAVGGNIPVFHAVDQEGREQAFESIRGPRGAMLVFHRSADW